MKPPIPWLRVFVEGVVIVGSILMAFGIDAWWEGRQEREEEHYLLTRIDEDLTRDIGQLEGTIRLARVRIGAITALHRALDHPYADATDLDGIEVPPPSGELIWDARRAGVFDHQNGAFRELLSTGGIQILTDLELRSEIAEYYGEVVGIIEINGLIRRAESDYLDALAEAGIAVTDSRFAGVNPVRALAGQERLLAEMRDVRRIARSTVNSLEPILERAHALRSRIRELGGVT